jgi:hypothetical protein
VRAEARRPDAFEVIAPFGAGPEATADELIAAAARWRQAGATAFQVGIAAGSFAELVARLAWFGREVIARVP